MPFVHITDTMLTLSEVWEGGRWALNKLYTVLPSDIRDEIVAVHIPSVPVGHESLRWAVTNDGRYTTHSAYHSLVETEVANPGIWRSIRRAKVPEKQRFFLWLIQK